jgi:predicted DNA binding protein
MRKLILELEPYEMIKDELKPIFEIIHSFEILETLKINWEDGIRVDLIECLLNETQSIDDVKSIGDMEILSVLKSEGLKHICLIKYSEPEENRELFKEFDLNLINTTPFFVSTNKHIYSVIGENKSLNKYIELIKERIGNIQNMTFKRSAYQKHDILSVLTDKQREMLISAHKFGYYDLPKKINSEQLSKKVNVSKPTLLQHLRKAEGRIFDEIIIGYSSKM